MALRQWPSNKKRGRELFHRVIRARERILCNRKSNPRDGTIRWLDRYKRHYLAEYPRFVIFKHTSFAFCAKLRIFTVHLITQIKVMTAVVALALRRPQYIELTRTQSFLATRTFSDRYYETFQVQFISIDHRIVNST